MFRFNRQVLTVLGAVVIGLLCTLVASTTQASSTVQADVNVTANAPWAALPLDHYWCYKTASTPVNEVVSLQDQFTTGLVPATVGAPDQFCNPVKKKHGDTVYKIKDPNAHLIMYNIGKPTQLLHTVQVQNQFGTRILKVYAPATQLAVPTMLVGTPAPASLDHFKCYKVTGDPANATVSLKDFLNSAPNVVVGKPVLLCNPTIKVHNDKQYDIQHPKAHLVCYKLKPLQYAGVVNTIDQFRAEALPISNPGMLCAPSLKKILS